MVNIVTDFEFAQREIKNTLKIKFDKTLKNLLSKKITEARRINSELGDMLRVGAIL